jgi:DNA processing protein
VTIVGTRSPSSYGIACCRSIIAGLAGYDICIASGLAYGIDGIALEAAVDAGLHTLAYPGSGVSDEAIYPKVHLALAHKILNAGGAIVSHFSDDEPARPYFFPERNRCLAALSNIVIAIECIKKSGTMITAMAAADFNVTLGAVPGPITSELSSGPHELFRHGAEPIECARDILKLLGYVSDERNDRGDEPPDDCGPEERSIYTALRSPKTQDELLDELRLPAHDLSRWLTVLELKGHIVFRAGTIERA